jgi:hypothetical protein
VVPCSLAILGLAKTCNTKSGLFLASLRARSRAGHLYGKQIEQSRRVEISEKESIRIGTPGCF